MKRELYYLLGPRLRRVARRAYFLPVDTFNFITGKRHKLTPPIGKVFIGSGDFTKQGESILNQMTTYGGLKPEHRVLDIGCGIGRLAVPLLDFLNDKGSYEGFDIVKSGIDWCKKNIESINPNFKFTFVNLKNDLYNLETQDEASKFTFPYSDAEFDFSLSTSVFTHMMPEDMENYIKEISRVLKKDGVCFATFFVMNDDRKNEITKDCIITFDYKYDNYYLHNKKVKEANIAFDKDYLFKIFEKYNLEVANFYPGYWTGQDKADHIDFQDVFVLKKL